MNYDIFNTPTNMWWNNPNIQDSQKHSEQLAKMFATCQSLSDKINSMKDIKIVIEEKSLENEDKSFTMRLKGQLNTSNKKFVSELAERFSDILETYKKTKIEELGKELDKTMNEIQNLFRTYNLFGTNLSSGVIGGNQGITYTTGGKQLNGVILNSSSSSIEWLKKE